MSDYRLHVRLEVGGQVLEFTEKDLASIRWGTPHDVRDVTKPGAVFTERELGAMHFTLDATFPEDAPARWGAADDRV